MKEVKNLQISEGITYSGEVMSDGYMDVPHGMGICKFSNHNETGRFQDGELNGMAYLNYHEWMAVGLVQNGVINGWGLKVNRGKIEFGIYEDSVLRVNLTPLIEIFWSKILEVASMMNRNAISVKKNGNILVGVPQAFLRGQFGFNFLSNGEVFLGVNDFDEKGITGHFLHFDLDYNITKGIFREGDFVKGVDDSDFVSACQVWVNHEYMDFDINMNYSMDSFLFGEKKLLHIVEVGKTPDNLIIKANIGKVSGNRFECEGGVNSDTIWFMFPADNEDVEERMMEIANGDNPWMPDFSEYCVEFYNNFREANNYHQVVYKHITCFDEDADYELDIFDYTDPSEYGAEFVDDNEDEVVFGPQALSLIPNFSYKKMQLENQWRSNGWYFTYPSLRDYVESLAEGDDVENFFGWLFDNPMFNNSEAWNLPQNYQEAYFQFLNLFPSID